MADVDDFSFAVSWKEGEYWEETGERRKGNRPTLVVWAQGRGEGGCERGRFAAEEDGDGGHCCRACVGFGSLVHSYLRVRIL